MQRPNSEAPVVTPRPHPVTLLQPATKFSVMKEALLYGTLISARRVAAGSDTTFFSPLNFVGVSCCNARGPSRLSSHDPMGNCL